MRRERAVKDKARKAIVVFVLHVTEWALRITHKLRGRAKKFERRAALQPVGQRSTHHCAWCPSLWEVELHLRKCAGSANQGPMKAVKRICRLRRDKLPQSPRGAVSYDDALVAGNGFILSCS